MIGAVAVAASAGDCVRNEVGRGALRPALRADLLPAAVGSQRRRSEARAQLPAVGDKRSPTTPLHPPSTCASRGRGGPNMTTPSVRPAAQDTRRLPPAAMEDTLP